MIVRVFRARCKEGQDTAFEALLRRESVPAMSRARGLVALYPGRPVTRSGEFVMVSVWATEDALHAFAGEDYERPILFGDEATVVESCDVQHFEAFGVDGSDDD